MERMIEVEKMDLLPQKWKSVVSVGVEVECFLDTEKLGIYHERTQQFNDEGFPVCGYEHCDGCDDCFEYSDDDDDEAIKQVARQLKLKKWDSKNDCSIDAEDSCDLPVEFVSVPFTDQKSLNKSLVELWKHGIGSNSSCGFHVHVRLTKEALKKVCSYGFVKDFQELTRQDSSFLDKERYQKVMYYSRND